MIRDRAILPGTDTASPVHARTRLRRNRCAIPRAIHPWIAVALDHSRYQTSSYKLRRGAINKSPNSSPATSEISNVTSSAAM